MKKILFLDDSVKRHTAFSKQNIGLLDIIHVYDAEQAINALAKEQFPIVSLDHDLSEDTELQLADNSGYNVALYIADMPAEKRPSIVIIHSLNPAGAARMIAALKGKVDSLLRIPFFM